MTEEQLAKGKEIELRLENNNKFVWDLDKVIVHIKENEDHPFVVRGNYSGDPQITINHKYRSCILMSLNFIKEEKLERIIELEKEMEEL